MKISVCIPVFKRPKELFEGLCSVLLQGHDDIEVVIQDGAPELSKDDPKLGHLLNLLGDRLQYHSCKDYGIFDAVNRCLKYSTGDILYFMCSDDLVCPGAFYAVHEAFVRERRGSPYWVYGQTISAHKSGRTQGIDGEPTTYEQLLEHNRIGQPSVFWNRAMMNIVGMFDPRLRHAADYDLWLRFWRMREPEYIPQTLGIFRHHDKQNTEMFHDEVDAEAKRISERNFKFPSMIDRAQRLLRMKQLYPDGFPESVN